MKKWDKRFMRMAKEVSKWSKDPSTQTGCILVSPDRTRTVIGYNGFPAMMPDLDHLYRQKEEKYSRIIHAEMNTLLNSPGSVRGWTAYCYPLFPCDRCAVHLIQAGIARVVSIPLETQHNHWKDALARSVAYFEQSGVEVCIERMK